MLDDHPRALVIAYGVELPDHADTCDGNRKRNIGLSDRQRTARPHRHVAAHQCALERLIKCEPRLACLAPVIRPKRAVDAFARFERFGVSDRFDAVNVPVMMLARATPERR